MPFDVLSSEIISECLREYGKGQLFFRTDGLQLEARRAQLRREYLSAHPDTNPEHHQAILKTAVTPGMTKPEVTAAWGLLEEDTRTAFGHVTDDERAAYACFTGFAVGERYALYFKDDVVLGVRQTEEVVPPHERELEMRLAEETRGLFYFYDYGDSLTGNDADYAHALNDLHSPSWRSETITTWRVSQIEEHVNAKGLRSEYLAELQRLGLNRESVSAAECARVALGILPYPPLPPTPQTGKQATIFDDRGNPVTLCNPPEEWFWLVAGDRPQQVAFPSVAGEDERVNARWCKGGLFVVQQIPLWVNGVSQFDLIEADWQNGDPVPRFQRIVKNVGYRTVRVVLTDAAYCELLARFATTLVAERYMGRYRLEHDVLVFTMPESRLHPTLAKQLDFMRANWLYTDTLSQD